MTAASSTDPSLAETVLRTTAPYFVLAFENASEPLNGVIAMPPVTTPSPRGLPLPSSRTWVWTVPSNAMATPVNVTGDVIKASQAGSVSRMAGVPAPRTHHELGESIFLTSTVVTGPVLFGWTGTSPERASPCFNEPTTGLAMWR